MNVAHGQDVQGSSNERNMWCNEQQNMMQPHATQHFPTSIST